jgi:enoyl-CoA hydratase/carnithine racemase
MNDAPLIQTQITGSVLQLTLDDHATRNSLSEDMMRQLSSLLADASQMYEIRVIILSAKGKVFSSGHNLKELTAHRTDPDKGLGYYEKIFAQCSELMLSINHHRCPVIAKVDGLASAAGCQLVASCDLAYASPEASFCTPGVHIGLFCSTPMVPLSRTISSKHAMEMLLTGKIKDAEFAARIGLINAVVPKRELNQHVMTVAQTIAAKSQAAISYGKRTFYDQRSLALNDAYALASSVMVKNMLDGAACEGLDAFINKRQPNWPEPLS